MDEKQLAGRWIFIFEDGYVVPVKERLLLMLIRKMISSGNDAYSPDLTVRKVIGARNKRCRFWDLLGVILGPAWSAQPSLSEPIRRFDLAELKSVVGPQLIQWSRECGIPLALAKKALDEADSFEAIFELLADPGRLEGDLP